MNRMLLAFIICVTLCACDSKRNVKKERVFIGSWMGKAEGLTRILTFTADGFGSVEVGTSALTRSVVMPKDRFKWKVDENSKLHVTFTHEEGYFADSSEIRYRITNSSLTFQEGFFGVKEFLRLTEPKDTKMRG